MTAKEIVGTIAAKKQKIQVTMSSDEAASHRTTPKRTLLLLTESNKETNTKAK